MNNLILPILFAATLVAPPARAQRGYVRDAVREKEYDVHGASGESKLNGWLGNLADVKVARIYTFPVHLRLHTKTYGRNGRVKDEQDMELYVNAAKNLTAVRLYEEKRGEVRPSIFTLYDYKANSSLVFDLKKNTYMGFNLNAFMSKENQTRRETGNARVNEHIDCKKSGRTKVIRGYTCQEFVCADDRSGERHEYWIAASLPYTMNDALARTMRQRYGGNNPGMAGAILEQYDYKGDELIREMMLLELNPKENYRFETAGYTYNGIGEVHFYD